MTAKKTNLTRRPALPAKPAEDFEAWVNAAPDGTPKAKSTREVKSTQVSLRIPSELLAKAEAAADRMGIKRSSYLIFAIAQQVKADGG